MHLFSFSKVEADLKRVVVVGHINTSSFGCPYGQGQHYIAVYTRMLFSCYFAS